MSRPFPAYDLLQPLVWRDWVGLFPLKALFHVSLGAFWSIRLLWEGDQLESWVASFTCCEDVHARELYVGTTKGTLKSPWGLFFFFFFCCIRGMSGFPRHIQLSNPMDVGGDPLCHWWWIDLPPVREGKLAETAWSLPPVHMSRCSSSTHVHAV